MSDLRPLTEQEKAIASKQLIRLNNEAEKLQYYKDYETLMVNAGLRINYEKQLSEHIGKLQEITTDLDHNLEKTKQLTDWFTYGVPVEPVESADPGIPQISDERETGDDQ